MRWEARPAYLANVGIRVIRVDSSVLLHVLKGVGHVAPTTAAVAGDAVNKVLGAQVEHFARLLLQLPLQSARRAERPARSTLALPRKKGAIKSATSLHRCVRVLGMFFFPMSVVNYWSASEKVLCKKQGIPLRGG